MAVFVLRRLLWTIPVLLVVFTATFFMLRAIGGNPFRHGALLGHGNPVDYPLVRGLTLVLAVVVVLVNRAVDVLHGLLYPRRARAAIASAA